MAYVFRQYQGDRNAPFKLCSGMVNPHIPASPDKSLLGAPFLVLNQVNIWSSISICVFKDGFMTHQQLNILISFKFFSYKETKSKILKAKTNLFLQGQIFKQQQRYFLFNSYLLCMTGIVFMSTYFPFDLNRFYLKNLTLKNSLKERCLVGQKSILPKGSKNN